MTPQEVLNAAKQGNPEAITALINRALQPKGITARAKLVNGTLQVMLEGNITPNQSESVAYVAKGIKGLGIPGISHLIIAGRAVGSEQLEWTERIELIPQQQTIQVPKISTSPKREHPQSTPGRPASGLKYQAPSMERNHLIKFAISSAIGVAVGFACGFLVGRIPPAPTVTAAEAGIVADLLTKDQGNLTKDQIDSLTGVKGKLASSGPGGDNYIWENADGSNLTVAWLAGGVGVLVTPDRLR
jgi:hypothetical protein